MARFSLALCLWSAFAAGALAQSGTADLAALEQTARQRTADWKKLSDSLEGSIARLLPCDAKITEAITAVSRASEARLAALSAYLNAAQQDAARETESAKRVLASGDALMAALNEEKMDVAQERAGVEMQLADLTASAKQKAALADSESALQGIAGMVRQRADLVQGGLNRREALAAALKDLVAAFEARDAALKAEIASYETERARWGAYYLARLSRAQTECAVTRGVAEPAPARRPRGKKQ